MRITDPVALKQFKRVVKFNAIMTIIENIVFLVIGKWDFTVLFGSLWGLLLACFFFYKICKQSNTITSTTYTCYYGFWKFSF